MEQCCGSSMRFSVGEAACVEGSSGFAGGEESSGFAGGEGSSGFAGGEESSGFAGGEGSSLRKTASDASRSPFPLPVG